MINWLWLLLIFPVGWFMFFLGVVMSNNSRLDDELELKEKK